MGWAVGYDSNWNRDVGYGVPAHCDHPDCDTEIDRGLGHVCGGDVYGGEDGCGLFFCCGHLAYATGPQQCEQCIAGSDPFDPKPDVAEWINHKLTHESWQQWRDENPAEVTALSAARSAAAVDLVARTQAALDGVTEGPWMAGKGGPGYSSWVDSKPDLVNISIADRIDSLADAEFIAESRQLVPDLLAEVVKLRARIEIIRCLSSANANAFHVIGDVCREKAWLDILAVIEQESPRG